MIRAIFKLPKTFHVLIIDDHSPDGTAEIVKHLMKEFPTQLLMTERQGKLGLGTAYLAGFNRALESGYQYIFEMDADFSHNPDDLLQLYKACAEDGADLAIGSRYISGINVINWPLKRVLMSYSASKYVRLVTGMKIMDTTAGFKCYRKNVLACIDLNRIKMKGYGFQIEMKFKAWKLGFKIVEVPIIFTDRKEGASKMSGSIFGEAFKGVIKMKIASYFTDPGKKIQIHKANNQ
jgi:dolichol-phosphate mannosyltransferase